MRFSSKIDLWLVLVLGGATAATLWGLRQVLAEPDAFAVGVAFVVAALGVGLLLWLLVRCGPFRTRIALDQIRSVKPSRSLASAPALSLDRLAVAYGRVGSVLISPKDKAGLIAALRQQAPGAQIVYP